MILNSSILLCRSSTSLPPEIAEDTSLMQYVIKGSDKQWAKALEGKSIGGPASVQIQSVRDKRKLEADDMEREASNESKLEKTMGKKAKRTSKKGSKKVRA